MALLKQLNEVCRSYAYTTFDKNSIAIPIGKYNNRNYYLVLKWGQAPGISSVSNYSNTEFKSKYLKQYDALIVDSAYGTQVSPDEFKALVLSESGSTKHKDTAWKNDPAQVFVPGDYTEDKGKKLGMKREDLKKMTGKDSVKKGLQWLQFKKTKDYQYRLKTMPEGTKQGDMIRECQYQEDDAKAGFQGYKGWTESQRQKGDRTYKIYQKR